MNISVLFALGNGNCSAAASYEVLFTNRSISFAIPRNNIVERESQLQNGERERERERETDRVINYDLTIIRLACDFYALQVRETIDGMQRRANVKSRCRKSVL